jgi:alkanesulfonate monooxygenase SsuD/methylene tetrahydromethanopterin reductase-like flavin-dependent oxidoreductase (luciferase family)
VPDQVAITLPVEDGLPAADYVALAELAERCGYDAVLAGEVAGPEVFSLLGMIAARTTSIRIGSGVAGIYARPPALTAMGFATLASCAPGRVIAGLGTSSPIIVEGWYGRPFGHPVTTAAEFIAVLRQALTGTPVSFAGRQLSSAGFRATMTAPSPVPVLLAAMNPAMLRLAGRTADGVFLTWTPPGEVASRLAHVRDGERMRRVVLQYAMVPTHQASFRGSFPALGEAAAAWAHGDRRAALRLVGEDTVDALCAIGAAETVADHVRALRAAGVALPVVLTPGAEPGDVAGSRATISALAAALGLPPRAAR